MQKDMFEVANENSIQVQSGPNNGETRAQNVRISF